MMLCEPSHDTTRCATLQQSGCTQSRFERLEVARELLLSSRWGIQGQHHLGYRHRVVVVTRRNEVSTRIGSRAVVRDLEQWFAI